MSELRKNITDIFNIVLFYIFRFVAVFLGLYVGYLIISKYLENSNNILEELCLTNPQNCSNIDIYRPPQGSTFIAKESISQIWFWYNGVYLYVYGQAAGQCSPIGDQAFSPVTVFQMNYDSDNNIQFTQLPNECIPTYEYIINRYVTEMGAKKDTVLLYRKDPSEVNSIYNVIKNMIDNKIFVL